MTGGVDGREHTDGRTCAHCGVALGEHRGAGHFWQEPSILTPGGWAEAAFKPMIDRAVAALRNDDSPGDDTGWARLVHDLKEALKRVASERAALLVRVETAEALAQMYLEGALRAERERDEAQAAIAKVVELCDEVEADPECMSALWTSHIRRVLNEHPKTATEGPAT